MLLYIEGKYMKNSVIAIQSFVITTIVYALLAPIFFEMENNAFGKGEYFVEDDDDNKDHICIINK
jgi:hypothetical protein